ncbi:MAG: hypothetical protein H8E31_09385 [Planctomycetes bacterium]|nr:hypothetical protein [Planctomycetota bacterium]
MHYRIDSQGRIVDVSLEWLDFARENCAHRLDRQALVGRPLWEFIAGSETRCLYEMVFERVRKEEVTVTLPFRCDSPTLRRFMQLVVRPAPEGWLELEGQVIRTEVRAEVPLLDPSAVRSEEFLNICSWCKKVQRSQDEWIEVEGAIADLELFAAPVLPQLSHGLCPACAVVVREEVEEAARAFREQRDQPDG